MKRVYLEITNNCNLNCSFCSYKKGNNYLTLEEIDNYSTQIKEFTNYIYLHILGEPLLHPQFEQILDILDQKELSVQLVTNGTLLYKHQDILKHKCIRKLSISIHSINNLDINENYFKQINNLIENNNDKTIELRFYNKQQLSDKLISYLNSLKEKYKFEDTKKENSYRIKEHIYVYFQDFFKWPEIEDAIVSDQGTCHGGIDMIGINSKSDVTICCLDPKAYNKLGNLKEKSLKEILESDLYKKYIEDFRNHKINYELCKRCTYRLRFK
ncbi:MAG: radical SAM protein [Erysipelotrichaceae bacterium]|nr:radical SAM protein [Erysipelotrichaceae bacterium]